MLNLALWLKRNKFRIDQVQTFYPSPMSLATAMYHSDRDPLRKVSYKDKRIYTPKNIEQRRLQKAFLRYHDEKNWPVLRKALVVMGRADLIGNGPNQLIPAERKAGVQRSTSNRRGAKTKTWNKARGSQWSSKR